MQAHFHEKHAGCEHPELLGTTAIVRNQRRSCGMGCAFAGAIVEYAPVRATGIERVQNDAAGRIVEGLDEGSGKIENNGALSACPGLGKELAEGNGLAGAGRADQHGMALLESPRPGDAREMCRTVEAGRSEEHTSELQSLMRLSYAVVCLKKTHKHDLTH